MMNIKRYTDSDGADMYFALLNDMYGAHHAFRYFISDMQKALHYSFSSKKQSISCIQITGLSGDILAHIALIEDDRLSAGEAFWGFFECRNDSELFAKLWSSLLDAAREKGIKKLMGPVNGSIWHPYRVVSMNSAEPFFPSEPLTQDYYSDLIRTLKPASVAEYHSAFRRRFDLIMMATEPSLNQAVASGVQIKPVPHVDATLLKPIFDLSKTIFSSNWGYTELSFDEFLALYNSDKIKEFISSVYTVMTGTELIGFCSNIGYENTLVMKTIGVLPEWQGKGIGNALVYAVHRDACEKGITKIIYGLVKKDNKVKHFPMDDIEVFREYSAFEFIVS